MAQDPLTLLCIEPRFPGRLGAVCDWLVRRRGYRCFCLCASPDSREFWPPSTGKGIDVIQYPVGAIARDSAVPWTRDLERGLSHVQGAWEVLHSRRLRGIDLILGRSATLGSTLFAPVAYPRVPVVNLFDYYYHPHDYDLTADILPSVSPAYFYWRRTANAMALLDIENGAHPWVSTRWQRGLFPREYRDDFLVLHPGIDTLRFRRPDMAPRSLDGRLLRPGTRVVSFVASNLDRVRGFDRFVTLVNRLQPDFPDVLFIAVGGFTVQRGLDVEYFSTDFAHMFLQTTPLHDRQRLWLLGATPPNVVFDLLANSTLHVYPSRTYPVAHSLLEAMACSCTILAWDSEPVREVVSHEQTGLLAPPDDLDAAVAQARSVLTDPAAFAPLGRAAAEHVRQFYSQEVNLPALAAYFDSLLKSPP